MNNKYLLFAIKVVGQVADALEDGRITPDEIQEFVIMMITEIPKLLKEKKES